MDECFRVLSDQSPDHTLELPERHRIMSGSIHKGEEIVVSPPLEDAPCILLIRDIVDIVEVI